MVCYGGAILCRSLFVALPVVLLLLDAWPYRRMGWRPVTEKTPLFALMVFGAILHITVRSNVVPIHADGAEGGGLILHQFAALVARLFWPFGLSPYQPSATTVGGLALGWGFDIGMALFILTALV